MYICTFAIVFSMFIDLLPKDSLSTYPFSKSENVLFVFHFPNPQRKQMVDQISDQVLSESGI